MREMMLHVTHAATSAQAMKSYSFISREGMARYEVRADPNDKTARLRIHPAFGSSDLRHYDATFSLDEARRLKALILQADHAKEWFEKNQGVFVTKPWQRLPQ